MTDQTENLIIEHLKRFHAGQERIEHRLEEIVQRIGHVEMSVASLRKDFAHGEEASAAMAVRFDRMSDRIDRIERRLELREIT